MWYSSAGKPEPIALSDWVFWVYGASRAGVGWGKKRCTWRNAGEVHWLSILHTCRINDLYGTTCAAICEDNYNLVWNLGDVVWKTKSRRIESFLLESMAFSTPMLTVHWNCFRNKIPRDVHFSKPLYAGKRLLGREITRACHETIQSGHRARLNWRRGLHMRGKGRLSIWY